MIGPQRTRTLAATLALVSLSGLSLAARAQDTPPPAGNPAPSVTPAPGPGDVAPAAPPPGQPTGPTPGQPGYPPPGQSYPPGYGPPGGYAPGYPPPGGYAPGYPPPGYPPGYAPPRYAPPAPMEPIHSGVYLHLHLGGGFTSISGSDGNGGTLKISGGGPSFAVAVGGAVAPNLAIFGNLFFTSASQPNLTDGGVNLGQAGGDALVGGFGAGVVYYFMPVNIYLSGAIAAVDFQADDSNGKTTYQSDTGVGFEGMIGKEFWVSEHWGLGAALEFVGASMKDKDNSSITWSAGAFNVLFSATCF
jgi:hypothetical protein